MILTLKLHIDNPKTIKIDGDVFDDPSNVSDDDKIETAYNEVADIVDSNEGDLNLILDELGGEVNRIELEDVEFSDDDEIEVTE